MNAVRLHTLKGALRDVRRRIAHYAGTPPDWFDTDEGACWGFALGQVDFALASILRDAEGHSAGATPLEIYRSARDAVLHVASVCRARSAPRNRYDVATALALETAADELVPILRDADRAPHWLRERAQRTSARARP